MENELESLYEELEKVKSSTLEYLPEYGYSSKKEIMELIQDDIDELEKVQEVFDYTDEELEDERSFLCFSQGIARYC